MQMADDIDVSPFEPLKILVRDLAPNTTQDDLNRYFTQFAHVTESIIPHNSVTGSPHSFGFVVFKNRAALRIPFILQLPHCIHDRCVEVSRALKGEDLQTLESQRNISTCHDNFERIGNFDQRKVFVRGWRRSPSITDDEFLRYFQGFGNVIYCCFLNDIGFGHVTFTNKRGADRVLYRHSYIINGRRLTVNILKHVLLDHNDAHNPNVRRRTINIQEEAEASSGIDHANGTTRDMQPQAATSYSHTRNVQIIPAAESSGTDHANDTTDMQPQAAESVSNTRDIQIIPAAESFHTGHPPNNYLRAKNMQQEKAESSGADHVDRTTYMQPQAAASISYTRDDMQIVPAAASSGTDHVNSTTDMQPQAAASVRDSRDEQIVLDTASSGTDHVNSTTDMKPQVAENVSNTRDMQIVPAAASSGTDHVNSTQPQAAESVSSTGDMQMIPAAAISDPRNMQNIIPAAASSRTGHPLNNSAYNRRWITCPNAGHISASGCTNFPPSDQSMLHPRMNYMVPGVTRLPFPGHRPTLHQAYNGMGIHTTANNQFHPAGVAHRAYNGMGIYTNAANNFHPPGAANFPQYYAGYGNFPMAPAEYPNQDFTYYFPTAPADYNSNQDFNKVPADYPNQDLNYYFSMTPADYNPNQDFNYYYSMAPADYNPNQDFNYYDNTNGYH